MPSSVPRLATSALALSLAAAALVSIPASANEPTAPSPSKTGTPKAETAPAETRAVGLIVRTEASKASDPLLTRIARAAAEPLDQVAGAGRGTFTVGFDEILPLAEAQEVAQQVEGVAGVLSVEPNLLLLPSVKPPVTVNDQYFGLQLGVWDKRNLGPSSSPPAGGYSVKAPTLWRATKGRSSTVVAVIDTGFTNHTDLNSNRLPGYDFVSADSDPSNRDGETGWDDDASDPGDYRELGQCGVVGTSNSSWHGTHVAGIVAAEDNNNIGITGVAPNVKFQPIRVLGPCGGALSDVAAAVRWAGGLEVPGAPEVAPNPTPADVINLSLGASEACGFEMQDAISAVRANGVVVVAAAGNDALIAIDTPANCQGVIAVTATNDRGLSASYSNVGHSSRRADISAPGGDSGDKYPGIVSTLNSGTTEPDDASYAYYRGTSMATPHVAGGAALLTALGYNSGQIEVALRKAVRAFPQWGDPLDCTSSQNAGPDDWDCGRGILDLGKVPALYGKRTIKGTAKVGKTLSITTKATGGVKPKYRWYRGSKAISGAKKSTYKVTRADRGKKIKVRVKLSKSGFRTQSFVSKPRKVAK